MAVRTAYSSQQILLHWLSALLVLLNWLISGKDGLPLRMMRPG